MSVYSKTLKHVNHKDFRRTHQRHLGEQEVLRKIEKEKLIQEKKELEEIKKISSPLKSNWRKDLLREFGEWVPIANAGGPTMGTSTTFGYYVGGSQVAGVTYTASGLGGSDSLPTTVTIDTGGGDFITVAAPTYNQLSLAGYASPLPFLRRNDLEDVNAMLDASQQFARAVGADYMMNARVQTIEDDLKKIAAQFDSSLIENMGKNIKLAIEAIKNGQQPPLVAPPDPPYTGMTYEQMIDENNKINDTYNNLLAPLYEQLNKYAGQVPPAGLVAKINALAEEQIKKQNDLYDRHLKDNQEYSALLAKRNDEWGKFVNAIESYRKGPSFNPPSQKVGPKIVGPKIVGPKIVGPKKVGPKKVGPKIVGPKKVGPKKVGPKSDLRQYDSGPRRTSGRIAVGRGGPLETVRGAARAAAAASAAQKIAPAAGSYLRGPASSASPQKIRDTFKTNPNLGARYSGRYGVNPLTNPVNWYNQGRDVRIPNERQAPFGSPLQYFSKNPNPKTLFGDDKLQMGQSNKSFAAGQRPGPIGRPDRAVFGVDLPQSLKQGKVVAVPARQGGPRSGPTPVTRQTLERSAQTATKILSTLARPGGAGLAQFGPDIFKQGQTGSTTYRAVNQAAKYVPGLKANPNTDIGKRAGDAIRNFITQKPSSQYNPGGGRQQYNQSRSKAKKQPK